MEVRSENCSFSTEMWTRNRDEILRRVCCLLYLTDFAEIRKLKTSLSEVWVLKTGDSRQFVLKTSGIKQDPLGRVLAIVRFQRFLCDHTICRVPRVCLIRNGRNLDNKVEVASDYVFEVQDGHYFLSEWIEGTQITPSSKNCFQLGKAVGLFLNATLARASAYTLLENCADDPHLYSDTVARNLQCDGFITAELAHGFGHVSKLFSSETVRVCETIAEEYREFKESISNEFTGRSMLHGDLTPNNILFVGEKSGYVDFDMCSLGDQHADLAWAMVICSTKNGRLDFYMLEGFLAGVQSEGACLSRFDRRTLAIMAKARCIASSMSPFRTIRKQLIHEKRKRIKESYRGKLAHAEVNLRIAKVLIERKSTFESVLYSCLK